MSKRVVEFVVGAALVASSLILPSNAVLGSSFIFGSAALTTMAADLVLGVGTAFVGRALLAQHVTALRINGASTSSALPVIYGRTIVGLRLIDVRQDPNDKNLLYVVGALCHGPIAAIEEIWFDERLAFDKDGNVQAGAAIYHTTPSPGWTPYAWLWKHLGGASDPVDSTMHTAFPDQWPTTATGKGIAYVVLKLQYNKDLYPNGLPNITVRVKGRTVYDPRTSTTAWSDNPILCLRDYLASTVYGFAATATELAHPDWSTLANVCDELVSTPRGNQPRFRCNGALDTNAELLQNAGQILSSCRGILLYQSGQFRPHIPRAVTASGITFDESVILGDWQFQTPGTRDAYNQVVCRFVNLGLIQPPNAGDLEILSDGSDTRQVTIVYLNASGTQQTVTKTLNGSTPVACGITCKTVQEIALSTTSTTRTVTIRAASGSLNGPMRIATVLPLESGVDNTGHQVSEVQWPGPNDVNNYLADDNGFLNTLTVELPFTDDYWRAQQLGMVLLKESRQGLVVQMTCTEAALQAQIGDVVAVTHPTPGWTGKLFWVVALAIQEDGSVGVALREYEPTAYDYTTSTDTDSIQDTDLPDPFTCDPVSGLTVTSDGTTLLKMADGTIVPRIHATWTNPSEFIKHVWVYAGKVGGGWSQTFTLEPGDTAEVFVTGCKAGDSWYVGVQVENTLDVRSAIEFATVTVVGKSAPPADVTGLAGTFLDGKIDFHWNPVGDVDLAAYEVRRGGTDWASATYVDTVKTTRYIQQPGSVTARSNTFRVKALDTSGNYSTNAATLALADPKPDATAISVVTDITVAVLATQFSVTVDLTGTEGTIYALYASLTAGFTPSAANRMQQLYFPSPGAGARFTFTPPDSAWIGKAVYFKIGVKDALTDVLGDGEQFSAQFTSSTVAVNSDAYPTAAIAFNAIDDSSGTYDLSAALGTAGVGPVKLRYRYTVLGDAPMAWSSWLSSPQNGVTFPRQKKYDVLVEVQAQDQGFAGGLNGLVTATTTLPALDPTTDDTTGLIASKYRLWLSVPNTAKNTAPNGDFEAGTLDFWQVAGTGATAAVVNSAANAHAGNWYATLASSGTNLADLLFADDAGSRRYVPVVPGQSVRISAYLKRTFGDGQIRLAIFWCDKDQASLSQSNSADVTSSSWTETSVRAVAPASAAFFFAGVQIHGATGSSTAAIDDVSYTVQLADKDAYGFGADKVGADGSVVLSSSIQQNDGAGTRPLTKGAQIGQGRNGDTIAFDPAYQNVPIVILDGGILHEPRSKWGTNGDGTESGAYGSTLPTYIDRVPLNLGALGFKLRARLRQKGGTSTLRQLDFTSANSLTSVGASTALTTTNAPSTDDTYKVNLKSTINPVEPAAGHPCNNHQLVLAIESYDGSNWTERKTITHSLEVCNGDGSASDTQTWLNQTIAVSGMTGSSQIRVRVKSYSGPGGSTFSVHAYNHSDDGGTYGVTFYNASDTYASMTPDTADAINITAMGVT